MTTNPTLDVIATRYTCRAYSDKPVPADVLDAIITAGLQAPSAMNRQPWRLVVVQGKDKMDAIDQAALAQVKETDPPAYERIQGRGGVMMYHAPMMIIIAGETDDAGYTDLDCGIMSAHLSLAAAALGVDSCIAGMPRHAFAGEAGAELAKQVGIPEGFRFRLGILLGFASGEVRPGHEIDRTKVIGL